MWSVPPERVFFFILYSAIVVILVGRPHRPWWQCAVGAAAMAALFYMLAVNQSWVSEMLAAR